jgi:hypothetical protein
MDGSEDGRNGRNGRPGFHHKKHATTIV